MNIQLIFLIVEALLLVLLVLFTVFRRKGITKLVLFFLSGILLIILAAGVVSFVFKVAGVYSLSGAFVLIAASAVVFSLLVITKIDQFLESYKNLAEDKKNPLDSSRFLPEMSETYLALDRKMIALSEEKTASGSLFTEKIGELRQNMSIINGQIKSQQNISKNLDSALHMQLSSLDEGAKGLDETRKMFKEMSQNFEVLFENINHLFEQNLQLQYENKNMEEASNNAIETTRNLRIVSQVGIEKIDKILDFIDRLSKSIEDIKQMIMIIKKISADTGILAMNAAIEAAHAGEAGRGFSVVADEIRKLAQSSSEATKYITEVVDKILQQMDEGKNHSTKAKSGINGIKGAIEDTVGIIDSLSTSVHNQITSISDMKENATKIHGLAEDIKYSSEDQEKHTEDIYQTIENLNSNAMMINTLITKQKKQFDKIIEETEHSLMEE